MNVLLRALGENKKLESSSNSSTAKDNIANACGSSLVDLPNLLTMTHKCICPRFIWLWWFSTGKQNEIIPRLGFYLCKSSKITRMTLRWIVQSLDGLHVEGYPYSLIIAFPVPLSILNFEGHFLIQTSAIMGKLYPVKMTNVVDILRTQPGIELRQGDCCGFN